MIEEKSKNTCIYVFSSCYAFSSRSTVNVNQRTPNYHYPPYYSALPCSLLLVRGTTFVKTAVYNGHKQLSQALKKVSDLLHQIQSRNSKLQATITDLCKASC